MKCPAPETLAEAVSSDDAVILAHAAGCTACQAALEDQRAMRVLVQQLPDAPLPRAHREALAAEILARADQLPARPRRGRLFPLVAIGLAVAAIALTIAFVPGRHTPTAQPIATPTPLAPPRPQITPIPQPARVTPESPAPVPIEPARAPAQLAKARVGGSGEFARDGQGERDLVTLTRGELTIDTVGTRPATVVTGDTAVGVRGGRIQVVAKRGVIAQVSVFAGSAEITVAGKRVVIEAGMTWDRNASREDSLAAFRTGWEALRAGHNADAIAAFELATDDVVAEDALYWSAIASERDHDAAGAVRRYRALLERFPSSPRAPQATAAIARLAP
ncbi:MAG: hypothetical protein IPQ07_04100 [Myxococcales bacterium]|nr:hypothetical protein [Myxococcales bacterium]